MAAKEAQPHGHITEQCNITPKSKENLESNPAAHPRARHEGLEGEKKKKKRENHTSRPWPKLNGDGTVPLWPEEKGHGDELHHQHHGGTGGATLHPAMAEHQSRSGTLEPRPRRNPSQGLGRARPHRTGKSKSPG